MTKFKGSLLCKKLQSDQSIATALATPSTPWIKTSSPFSSSQVTMDTTQPKTSHHMSSLPFHGHGATAPPSQDESEDRSSPVMDLTSNNKSSSSSSFHSQRSSPSVHVSQYMSGNDHEDQIKSSWIRSLGMNAHSHSHQSEADNHHHHSMVTGHHLNEHNLQRHSRDVTQFMSHHQLQLERETNQSPSNLSTSSSGGSKHSLSVGSNGMLSIGGKKRKPNPIPEDCKDNAYWERRRRNNESAKRSREQRRVKEQQQSKKVMILEQDNLKLKTEVDMLREELNKLRDILYNNNNNNPRNNNNNYH